MKKRKFNKGDIVEAYVYGEYRGEWEITGWEYDPYIRVYRYQVKSTLDETMTTGFEEWCLES